MKSKYKSYPSYRDSGVEWLGDVPTGWTTKRLKNIISASITDGPHETPKFLDEGIPFLSVDGIQNGELAFEKCRFISPEAHKLYRKKAYIQKDDILLGKAASIGKVARVKVDFEFGIWSPLALIKPDISNVTPSYLEYLLKSSLTQYQIQQLSTSNTQQNISMGDIPKFIFSMPQLKEQQTIAHYLDYATAKIDTLIEKQTKLIALLKEKRQAVISTAVTRGLDNTVAMKDSGVEWLGEIPEHWKVIKTKYLFNLITEPAHSNNNYELLSIYTDIGVKPRKDLEQKGNKSTTTDGYWKVRQKDIIVNKLLAWMGAIGVSNYAGVTSPAYDILRANDGINPDFYHLLFRTKKAQTEFKKWSRGIMEMRLRLYFSELGQIKMPVPPYDEQQEIIKKIDERTTKIDTLITKATKAINLLKEKRTALISSAVTGKIDVREINKY